MQQIDRAPYDHFQTGAALMKEAMEDVPERVPIYAQMHEFVSHQAGIPSREFYGHPELMVPASLEIQSNFKLDVANLTYDVYNIEAEGLGQKLLQGDTLMPDIDRSQPLIQDESDLELIVTPDFERAGRFSQIIQMHSFYQRLTGLTPGLSFCAPFTLAANIFGFERLIVGIYQRPDFIHKLLDRLIENVLVPWILYQKAQFPGTVAITGVDAMASIPLVNFHILKDWVVPSIKKVQDLCKLEIRVLNWVGEHHLQNPEMMMEFKRIVGAGLILGQDPDVEKLGPLFYKDYSTKHNLGLILGIGAGFLAKSSLDQIYYRVRNYISVGKPGGHFALYLCNVDAQTPPDHIKAVVDTVHGFGKY
jgi:uroporphyrinogen-III decarboxylase